MNSKQ